MSESLYSVQELYTNGWQNVREHLSRSAASELLQTLIDEGSNPEYLRAVRED